MKSFTEMITSLISPKSTRLLVSDASSVDFVRTRKGVLKELTTSRDHKTIVGVYCRSFGEGMFLIAVEDIQHLGKAEIILFYPYDLSGKKLSSTRVQLDDIQMVCPFNKVYRHPMFNGETSEKANSISHATTAVWL